MTLCHHIAHLVVYPLADYPSQDQGGDSIASVVIPLGDALDGIVPSVVVEVAHPLALIAAIAFFVRVWHVRRNGPAETVVEVAGGSYTLPSTNFMTFWEGVAAVVVFAVVGRVCHFLFMLFAEGVGDGPGGDVLQSLVDEKLLLAGCLAGLGIAVYGWLGSKGRRRVEREHLLGTLTEN